MRFSLKTALVLFVIAAFAVSWFQAWRKLAVTRQLSTVTIEEFTDRKKFESRLGELVEIGFDDVDTSKRDSVAIASDRYRQQGLAIDAAGGLYASRTFSFPQQYPPVSGRNSVAVGPPGKNPGGTETDFLFVTGSEPGLVSAVGVTFVDADFPSSGASGLTIFGWDDRQLAATKPIQGVNASHEFRGFIAVDADGELIPAIGRARATSGSGWPGVDAGDGVTMDDLMFTTPQPSPIR